MVVFEDGLPRKAEYRRFTVRGDTDDLAALSEVLRRRFTRYLEARAETGELGYEETASDPSGQERELPPDRLGFGNAHEPDRELRDPTTGKPRKFAYPPQLVVVDGGQPQVHAAAVVLAALGITEVAVCGLAKRLEEVWLPHQEYPVILPRQSEGLYLLQRIRDEAHRFAITFHRQRRSKRMTASGLDDIPGLGEVRRKALLRRFGSLKKLAAASADEIAEVPGIGPRTAEAIVAALSPASPDQRE
jgi:excinuclease ABC subunit C